MSNDKTIRREIKALRRPFLRECFRENRFTSRLNSGAIRANSALMIRIMAKP